MFLLQWLELFDEPEIPREELEENPESLPEIVEELTSGRSKSFFAQPKINNKNTKVAADLKYKERLTLFIT